MLRNRAYAGWVENKRFQIVERGNFDALIPQSVFDEAQLVLAGKRRPAVRHILNNPDFPLRRFVTCSICGGGLSGGWNKGRSKRYPNYRCAKCGGVNVTRDRLEGSFIQLLSQHQPSQSAMGELSEVALW